MSEKKYDLIVVGTGVASTPARKAAAAGWSVAIIDERPPGGTCALRGCSPKKMMRSGALAVDWAQRLEGNGLGNAGALTKSFADLVAFTNTFTDPIPEANKKNYEKQGIDFFEGKASFTGKNSLAVTAADGSVENLSAKKIVLAVGARPRDLALEGAEHVLISDEFFKLPELPNRVCFLGGGFISMEFAHIAAAFGAEATVVHTHPLPLTGFEPELVGPLVDYTKKHHGIRYVHDSRATRVEKIGNSYRITAIDPQGKEQTVEADLVFHGVGRVPNIDGLDLDKGGVTYSKRGIATNEYLQNPGNDAVYSCGDSADSGGPMLTYVATHEALTASHNILHGNERKPNYTGVTAVAFTIPAIASCGMTEQQCKDDGLDVEIRVSAETGRWFTNRHSNELIGGYKILVEKETDKIVGAHLLGHHCEEFINLFALAINKGMTRSDLKGPFYAHPSAASDLGRIIG